MRVAPLTRGFGAEVADVDLAEAVADLPGIERALWEFAVLIFKAQHLTDDGLADFATLFGPLEPLINRRGDMPRDGQRVVRLANTDREGNVLPPTHTRTLELHANREWHADGTFHKAPTKITVLAARVVPAVGGETQFVDMRAAYDALPDVDRDIVDDLRAVHDLAWSQSKAGAAVDDRLGTAVPPATQPLVVTHAESMRRSLRLGRHAKTIEGLTDAAGRQLLDRLLQHAVRPERVITHRWAAGDVVVWDNRSVMHRVLPWPDTQPRVLMRAAVAGDGC